MESDEFPLSAYSMMMAQVGQVDVGKDGDTVDVGGLVDVAKHGLVEDEDKELCVVELLPGMMQA